jgi:hydrogenase maturation protease
VKSLVAGIGSTIRGDDGVGVHAARQLRTRSLPDNVRVIELGTAGLALLDVVEGYDGLIVLDAIVTGAPCGTVHVLAGEEVARAVHLGAGHEADLPTTLSLGRKLMGSHMPQDVAVVAVEVGDLTTFSERLTPEVEAAIPDVIARVERLLKIA